MDLALTNEKDSRRFIVEDEATLAGLKRQYKSTEFLNAIV
jgi:hypothetical protein